MLLPLWRLYIVWRESTYRTEYLFYEDEDCELLRTILDGDDIIEHETAVESSTSLRALVLVTKASS